MNESKLSDQSLAELLTLTVEVNQWGATVYRNHLGHKHRIHGPAVITSTGNRYWYQNDQRHRDHGPAIEWASGRKFWFLHDEELTEEQFNERVKSSDAALAELLTLTVGVNVHGTTRHRNYLGQLHRAHGPAVIYSDGAEWWYQHDQLHRTDGPAIEWGDSHKEWLLNGEYITESEFNERIKTI